MKAVFKRVVDWGRCVALGFVRHNCPIHAAGLTYFLTLTFFPLLIHAV